MSRRPHRTERPARRSQARRLTLECLEVRELLTGYTVTTAADNGNNASPTAGSLRAAILLADSDNFIGADSISFNIPGSGVQTIALPSALPTISRTVVIDGTTQSGYSGTPEIVIDGSAAGVGANGLNFTGLTTTVATSNVIRGLSIVGFQTNAGLGGAAIYLQGGAGQSVIEGNYIGIEPDGSTAKANSSGIVISSANNTIGGTLAGTGNLISGNTNGGLLLIGSGASGNVVEGNKIGTNAAGTGAVGNTYGVLLSGPNNTIGGTTTSASNLISGNVGPGSETGVGVLFEGTATGDVVEGNRIGTDNTGSNPIGNVYGVYFGTPGGSTADHISLATIGGTVAGAGNLISGNFLGITGNTTTTLIAGNIIGLNSTGTTALPNSDGILLGANASTIGGTTAAARNVISGSSPNLGEAGTGLSLTGDSDLIEGNYVGTTAAGTGGTGIGNVVGMSLVLTSSTVGGTAAGAGNVISGNSGDAIDLIGNGTNGAVQTALGSVGIFGNVIGQAVGGASLPNAGNGISLTIGTPSGSTPTTPFALNDSIGGTAAGAGNTIVGNGGAGVVVRNSYATGVTGLGIRGNVISGNAKLGIDLTATGLAFPSTLFLNKTTVTGNQVTVSGVFFGQPSTAYSIDLFAGATDPSGYGQGGVYLGTVTGTTNASGFLVFSPTFTEPGTPYSTFTATSTGTDGNTQEFSANYPSVTAGPSAELAVTSTGPTTAATVNAPFTFTETITNHGSSTANNVLLYDSLPTSLVNVSAFTSNSGGTATFDTNNVLTARIGSIAPGQSVTVTITATSASQGVFTDEPGVSSTTYDPNYSDNFAQTSITIGPPIAAPSSDLAITEIASAPVTVGTNLTYTVTITNNGPNSSPVTNVNDFLPTGVTFLGAITSQGTVAAPATGSTLVTANLGNLASGASAVLTIVVNPTVAGSITNAANVSGSQFDPNRLNNSTSLTSTVTAAAPKINLVLSQSVNPTTGVVGQNEVFTLRVTNFGPSGATNATLIDSLPTGVTFVSASPTQGGSASVVNGVLTENFGTIAAGASATLTLIVRPTAPSLLINYAGAYSPDVPSAPFSFAYGAVSVPSGPSVIGLAKTNASKQIVVAFDEALNASTATNKANYQLVSLGTTGTGPRTTIAINSVSYNASNRLVTITPSQALNPTLYYQLVVIGSTSNGVSDTLGRRLVNPQYSSPGANYTANFYAGTLASF